MGDREDAGKVPGLEPAGVKCDNGRLFCTGRPVRMEKFKTLSGVAAPLPMINVDTDMIIPKQFLKTIKRTGLGKNLFDEMRYTPEGKEIPSFVLNKPGHDDG